MSSSATNSARTKWILYNATGERKQKKEFHVPRAFVIRRWRVTAIYGFDDANNYGLPRSRTIHVRYTNPCVRECIIEPGNGPPACPSIVAVRIIVSIYRFGSCYCQTIGDQLFVIVNKISSPRLMSRTMSQVESVNISPSDTVWQIGFTIRKTPVVSKI